MNSRLDKGCARSQSRICLIFKRVFAFVACTSPLRLKHIGDRCVKRLLKQVFLDSSKVELF